MKHKLLKSALFIGFAAPAHFLSAQCVTITCPSNISVNTDAGNCSAVVTYSAPVAVNSCGSSATQTFNYTGSLQTFTVPAGVTTLTIDASGAQGGSVTTTCAATGGLGARMVGDFTVTPGEVLSIMVGQQGLTNGSDAGGGGGTFVVRTGNVPLVCAGGGGGATNNIGSCGSNRNGINATITTSGTASGNGLVAGGINGNGGGASTGSGGGGGGFYTDGVAGTGLANNNGKAYVNGGAGGTGNNNDFGGYGGGGAGWFTGGNGGGGGGYSGGATSGSQPYTGGGGGGSYNAGSNQSNTAGFQTGNGRVIITYTANGPVSMTQIQGLASGAAFPVGTTTVTYAATDGGSNNDTCSFTVTVTDAQNPTAICQNSTVYLNSSGTALVTGSMLNNGSSDACGIASLSPSSTSFNCANVGANTVTLTVTDNNGNTNTCSSTVTVMDTIRPTAVCQNTTVYLDASGNAVITGAVLDNGSADICGIASLSASMTAFTCANVGANTVTLTVTDNNANTNTCSSTVTVMDTVPPAAVCQNPTVYLDSAGSALITGAQLDGGSADACGIASMTSSMSSFSCSDIGANTVMLTITDANGNSSSCSSVVTVVDSISPMIVCPSPVTTCAGTTVMIPATASDNCLGAAISYTLSGATTGSGSGDASGMFNAGVTTVTYMATDSSGNTSSCSFNVTVNPAPTVTSNVTTTTVCASDAAVSLSGAPAGGTWTGPGVSGTSFSPSTAGTGSHTIVYSYTDSSGCTGTASVVMTVNACVGIVENNSSASWQVYPNPTSGQLNIQLGAEYGEVEVSILQISGQLVQREQMKKTTSVNMSVDNLSSGVYFLTIKADGLVRTVKLVRN